MERIYKILFMAAGAEVVGDVAGVEVEVVGEVSSNKLGVFFCSFVPILASNQFQFQGNYPV